MEAALRGDWERVYVLAGNFSLEKKDKMADGRCKKSLNKVVFFFSVDSLNGALLM